MALNFQLQQPKLHYAGTNLVTRNTEPFADVSQGLGMPSLLEGASVGPMGLKEADAYTLPSAGPGSWYDGINKEAIGSTLQGVSVGISIGQAIGSVYSAWESGKTSKYVGKKQKEIAENNRQMAQMSAESAYRQGENQMAQLTYRAGQVRAQQRVAMGANGVRIGSGSTAEVLASTDVMKKLDMNTVRHNAISSAWGYKAQGIQASNAGSVARIMGDYGAQAGMSLAMGNLMDRGTLVAERWHKYFGEN